MKFPRVEYFLRKSDGYNWIQFLSFSLPFLCVQCCSKTEKYFLRINLIEINRTRQKRTRLFFHLNMHVWKCRPTWEQYTCAPGLELYCDLRFTLGIIMQALASAVMVQPFALRREGSETIHWRMSEWNVIFWVCIYSFKLIFYLCKTFHMPGILQNVIFC